MNLVRAYDLETVKGHYINVIENTPEIEKYARWVYGKHPTDEALRSFIENGEMYLLADGGTVAGMVAIRFTFWLSARNTGEEPSAIRSLNWPVNWQSNKGREQYVLMCWNPTIRPGIYMKRMDLFFGGKSTGTLKTLAGQISFCMKNYYKTMIY